MRLDPSVPPADVIEQARAFFDGRCPGYCIWVAAHADGDLERVALASGYAAISDAGTPRLALEHRLEPPVEPPGVRLVEVADEQGRQDFVDVTIAAYGEKFPADAVEAHLGVLDALRGDHVRAVVAYGGEVPSAAALTLVSDDAAGAPVAGIQMVGTIPAARGRGLGELCTRWAAHTGFEMGAAAVVLEASKQGEPLYLRMGFTEVSRYRWCLGPPAP